VSEADLLEQRRAGFRHLLAACALDEARHHHVLERVELGQEVVELEDEADRPVAEVPRARRSRARELSPRAGCAPSSGMSSVPMQWSSVLLPAPEARRSRRLALIDGEVDAPQHVELSPHVHEGLVQILDDDERLGHGPFHS
jgi:hypothetical protein